MRPVSLLLAIAWLLALLAGSPLQAAPRPNVLFLFSDDQRADTIHALGNSHLSTPNLDRLVAEGTTFSRAYCMGGQQGAICVPSRAMLMSGRTLFRVRENLEGQTTWPELFGRAGYRTFATGKWHNQAPALLRSFQSGKSIFLGGMGDPYNLIVQDLGPDGKLANRRKVEKHSVEAFADSAVEFLKEQRGDRPFLCYVAFNAPHDPRVAPQEYHDRANREKPPLPANFLPQHPFNNGELLVRDEQLAPWPRTPEVVRQHLADYYASTMWVDAQVGRILDALKASGQYENTLIVFASDHGLAIGSHGLMGKQNLYEHSMRAPLILAGPGIRRGQRTTAFAYLLDVFPTLGELAGVAAPEGSEGVSLVPVLTGKSQQARETIFTAYRGLQRAVRDDRWKLIVYPRVNQVQLFDLKNDPDERRNLAADPAQAKQLERLTALLRSAQERAGDHQALSTDHPDPLQIELKAPAAAAPKEGEE